MEKFSIVEKLNVNKLNEKVKEFIYKENHEPYIFANKETLEELTNLTINDELKCISSLPTITITTSYKSCFVGRFYGNKMFRDDTLEFGEIELR